MMYCLSLRVPRPSRIRHFSHPTSEFGWSDSRNAALNRTDDWSKRSPWRFRVGIAGSFSTALQGGFFSFDRRWSMAANIGTLVSVARTRWRRSSIGGGGTETWKPAAYAGLCSLAAPRRQPGCIPTPSRLQGPWCCASWATSNWVQPRAGEHTGDCTAERARGTDRRVTRMGTCERRLPAKARSAQQSVSVRP